MIRKVGTGFREKIMLEQEALGAGFAHTAFAPL
jgi:hypothetical protein